MRRAKPTAAEKQPQWELENCYPVIEAQTLGIPVDDYFKKPKYVFFLAIRRIFFISLILALYCFRAPC